MSFFEPRKPPEPPSDPPPEPEWSGPPVGVLGGVSSLRAVLFRTEEAILVAQYFMAYPTGVEFVLQFMFRTPRSSPRGARMILPPHNEAPEEAMQFGVQYPDGSKWTNTTVWMPRRGDEPPPAPIVFSRGGGGGDRSWRQRFWMWPLPDEGQLTFVVAWPELGIDEQSTVIDTTDLRRAAAEAEVLWED